MLKKRKNDGYRIYTLLCNYTHCRGYRNSYRDERKNHLRLGMMLGIKGMFYLICAIVNVIHYYGGTWSERYVIGLTVALAIMEGLAGMRNCLEEYILDYKEKNN